MTATTFTINGQPYTVNLANLASDISLNTFIREHAQLTATKYMCQEGGCGACVCAVRGKDAVTGEIRAWAVNSCLTLLHTCADLEIITAEGLGTKYSGYHPVQKRLANLHGTQCGYCSPGFVMNMYGLLDSKGGQVTMEEVENSFGGNICRCTGFRPILDAMKSFAVDSNIKLPEDCSMDIEDLQPRNCPKMDRQCTGSCTTKQLTIQDGSYWHWPKTIQSLFDAMKSFAVDSNIKMPEDCSMDIEDLQPRNCPKTGRQCTGSCTPKQMAINDGSYWHWPKTIQSLFEALASVAEGEEYMLVAGNTAHGVYRRSQEIKHFIDMSALNDLKQHKLSAQELKLGANLSLTDAMELFKQAEKQPGFEYCSQLWHHFDLIANVPVRNSGTLAGNITIKKQHPEFPSDIFICFEALDVQVLVRTDAQQEAQLSLADYLKDKRQKIVLTAFLLRPYSKEKYIFNSYKIMPRAQNAHAYVNAAFLIGIDATEFKVTSARICFGGIRPDFVHATTIENQLINQPLFDDKNLKTIFSSLKDLLKPDEVLPDTSPAFRTKLACGLFYKFLISSAPEDAVKRSIRSGGDILRRPLSSGLQIFATNEQNYPVSQPVAKIEGMIQCSGEAKYMNDVLTTANTVHCVFVGATKVGATIEQIDASEALKMPGVVAFYSAKDIHGPNTFVDTSFGYEEEPVFIEKTVHYYNEPLGMIVAISPQLAQRAISKVRVVYSKGNRQILPTMQDVFNAKATTRIINRTPPTIETVKCAEKPDIVANGIFEMGLQYHYTMEPQTAVVIPFEEGLKVYSSTQWTDHTQMVITKLLQVKARDVHLEVRRLGGGYGAKITRGNHVACAAALAATKLNRPTRFVQSIESMMNIIGKRWACRSDYEFSVRKDGKILGLTNTFYEDAGWSVNENPIELHSTFTAKNCYEFNAENFKLSGNSVITDAPSSTWCRAPGSVEGIAMIENILEHIAFAVNKDPAEVRLINIAKGNKLSDLLPKFLESREYYARRKEIDAFNEQNRWRKRGIGLAIMDYPVFLFGQYPATVSIYHIDGTVVVTHGGIEMGQGMNTKIAQVAAYTLGIPLEYIKIEASDTINGANSMVTGGAVGSESLCFAVRKCCETLNSRLKPIKDSLGKDAIWQHVVEEAYQKTIHMIASELYKAGDMQNYNVYGMALTEIELDVLTGNNQVTRVDILEDAGESLSPYIDIGQIEGAFVMCLGYWLTEQLVYNRETGQLLTDRTWTYKPPGAKDIPIDFRIELVQNKILPPGAFMRSKATGEPPCCLAVSVVFALQHALQSTRKDAGLPRHWLRLGAPTTPETLLLNAATNIEGYTFN